MRRSTSPPGPVRGGGFVGLFFRMFWGFLGLKVWLVAVGGRFGYQDQDLAGPVRCRDTRSWVAR